MILLLWIYYSTQILFFGAELTQVYAARYGSRIEPSEHAVKVEEVKVEKGKEPVTGGETERGRRSAPAPARSR